jgi:pyruvate-formate lyase
VKVLELTLHNGFDPRSGKQLGPKTGEPDSFKSYDDLFAAFRKQLHHFIGIKIHGSRLIERMYATLMPAPFLSVLIDDCIKNGRDYNAGGARYNNTFIKMVGLGSITDCLSAIKGMCYDGSESGSLEAEGSTRGPRAAFDGSSNASGSTAGPVVASDGPSNAKSEIHDEVSASRRNPHASGVCSPTLPLSKLVSVLDQNFANDEPLRQRLVNRTHKYGNDDDCADALMLDVFNACFEEVDGRPDARGGRYRILMLPTTCHVYFGKVTGAMPDGRKAGLPVSEGISPVQGADRRGPTAVIKSAAKMDHVKTGGTLLNMKFTPGLVATDDSLDKWAHLVRGYFKLDGHHVQFNVVTAATLRKAQAHPEQHRDLIVRVAGYSDYFCDLSKDLQEEIIARTEHAVF